MHLTALPCSASADALESTPSPIDAPGIGLLDVARTGTGSVATRAYATSPLRLLTPRNHGGAAWVYAASYGGGLLGGDAIRLTIDVGRGARAFISTQSSTKVYRSDGESSLRMGARVGAEGHLIVWPDPIVCFAGSAYRQDQQFDLDVAGSLVLVDWMTSGRRASGERWRFNRYETRTIVRIGGGVVLFDSQIFSAAEGDMAVRMGRFDVLCTAAIVGVPLAQHTEAIVSDVAARPIERRGEILIAAALLPAGARGAAVRAPSAGCVLRIAGPSVERVAAVLRRHLSFVPGLLGDDPWARKW